MVFFSPSVEASLGTLFTVGCLLHIYAFNPLLNFFSFDQMRLLESISKTNQLLQLSCTVLFSNLFHEGARENVQLKPRLTVSTCDLLGVSVFFLLVSLDVILFGGIFFVDGKGVGILPLSIH